MTPETICFRGYEPYGTNVISYNSLTAIETPAAAELQGSQLWQVF